MIGEGGEELLPVLSLHQINAREGRTSTTPRNHPAPPSQGDLPLQWLERVETILRYFFPSLGQNVRTSWREKYYGPKRGLCQRFFSLKKYSFKRICMYKKHMVRTLPSIQPVTKEWSWGADPYSDHHLDGLREIYFLQRVSFRIKGSTVCPHRT